MWSSLQAFSIVAALLVGAHASIGPVAQLTIANKVISPDGFTRDAVLAGGTFPGPIISGNIGDIIQINVLNSLTDPSLLNQTTVHWHDIFQQGTTWADGPAFVSQCPIVSGNSFLYNFDVPNQAGTFWYHSHISTQYCDGLRGAFIVYDPNDPQADLYDIDDDSTVITLADWYHYTLPLGSPVPAQNANSTLINGLGRYPGGNTTSPLAVITVESGKRYRFRLISTSCDPSYNFAIDNHTMTIIEADGQNTQPLVVDSLQIYAAQRYFFVLEANQTVGNYWIRANPNGTTIDGFADGINSAILRYVGAPDEEPTEVDPPVSVNPLYEFNLHPLDNPAAPGGPSVGDVGYALNLQLGFNATTGEFTMNGVSFASPSIPVLMQILSGNYDAQELLPLGSVYALPKNTTIELSLPGLSTGGPHPFHLHGHTFSVVRSAGIGGYNYENPVRRDTVNTGLGGDNVTIRFETNNPGPWFLHCHIDFHLAAGFAVVFAEDAPDIEIDNPVPADWQSLCPLYNEAFPGGTPLLLPPA